MKNNLNIVNNTERKRFEAELDNGEFAFIDYRFYNGNLAFMHTEVPEAYSGRGIAAKLAHAALEHARQENLKVMLFCAYMGSYVKRHPEYIDLLDQSYRQTGRHPG